jgi:hypothetical protein
VHPVAVRILHPTADALGPLERALFDARSANAERLAARFRSASAEEVRIVRERAKISFAAAVRSIATTLGDRGLVLAGAGALPLATHADAVALVAVAASGERRALANNRYSADVVAIGDPSVLRDLPELPGDNTLPRWLEEVARVEVDDLRRRWRLAVDLDSPLDVLLIDGDLPGEIDTSPVHSRLAALRAVGRDRRAELVVAGRASASSLRWLERATAGRVRGIVEERGLRASSRIALSDDGPRPDPARPERPPRSVLGMVLHDRSPGALGRVLGELGDGAIVDTRVLLAHRLGADERAWPKAEDRFASDLLLPDRIGDPWLRDLTASAVDARIPILLGGHTLVGPGVRLVFGRPAQVRL